MDKQCKGCLEVKPIERFSKHKGAKDGYRNFCKPCENNKNRENKKLAARIWRANHKEYLSQDRKKRNRYWKEEVMRHYGGAVCSCCGETHLEFLCFDHIEGGGTQHRKVIGNMGRQFYYWLKLQGYPVGYRVLCYNCNMSLGFYGFCPHQEKK